jgi:Trypsin
MRRASVERTDGSRQRSRCRQSSRRTLVALVSALVTLSAPAASASANVPGAQPNVPIAQRNGSIGLSATQRRAHTLAALRRFANQMHSRRAHASVVGGTPTAIEQVPWQVAMLAVFEFEGEEFIELCGGSIVRDDSHVLTAGHCVYNPFTGALLAPEDIAVAAGVSDLEEVDETPTSESRLVSGVRAHPYFDYEAGAGTPDDVAELELESPLIASAAVSPVALPTSSAPPAEGTGAVFSGFGEQDGETGELNGLLYSLGVSVGYSRTCGGEGDALFVCASAPTGSACSGDSGGGLLGGSQLIGVVDTVAIVGGRVCVPGATNGFANVTAPEILDFVDGSEAPPHAPQGGGAVISGVLRPGYSLTCAPGSWSGAPAFTFTFVDSAAGAVLQRGPSTAYALTSADVGRTILCEVQATNAGGTGIGRTPALPAIEAGATSSSAPVTGSPAGAAPVTSEAGGLGTKAQMISSAEIAALLRKAIVPTGKGAKIASLAKVGAYTLTFAAPEAGTVSVAWYRGDGSAASVGSKRSLIATGRGTFSKAGSGRVVVKLTPAGRRWLKGRRRGAVIADGSFTTPDGPPVTVSKGFVLVR